MTGETVKMEITEQPDRKNRIDIPWDLGEWVDKSTLVRWIVEDIETLDWENPELKELLQRRLNYQPRMLLQLLTYAYATGAFGADEVELAFYDKAFGPLGWNKPPNLRAIQRFRRENRGLIKWTLVQLLRRAVRSKIELGDRLLPGLQRCLVQNAVERLDLARYVDLAAAED